MFFNNNKKDLKSSGIVELQIEIDIFWETQGFLVGPKISEQHILPKLILKKINNLDLTVL